MDEGRFKIRDNKRLKYFYVNINNLSPADSGTYWCGSDKTWQHANHTKILLSVGKYTEHFSAVLYCISYSVCTYAPNAIQLFNQNKTMLLLMNRYAVTYYCSPSIKVLGIFCFEYSCITKLKK